jgi:O-antigen ligase
MVHSKLSKTISGVLSLGAFLTTVLVWAYYTNDPVNTPKLASLALTAFVCLGLLVSGRKELNRFANFKAVYVICGFFVFWSLISILVSKTAITDSFYGAWGRNTGFFAYLCLVILFIASANVVDLTKIRRVMDALYFAGLANLIYFMLTQFNVELIPWNNAYGRILGTFGNPNFLGAFMGLFGVILFSRIIDKKESKWNRLLSFALLIITAYEIKLSLASQGVVVLGGGISLLLFFYIKNKYSRLFILLYSIPLFFFGLLALLGALNKGPLGPSIYKPSITFRGQYWDAAWQAGMNHPIFGVGMDSFGYWYGRVRTAESIIYPGPETTTNAAHNVYLDLFAYGGFPLFISFIALNLLVIFKAVTITLKVKHFDLQAYTLVTLWVAFQIQSLISINQIGIAIWGWIFSGLILGYQVENRVLEDTKPHKSLKSEKKGRNATVKNKEISIAPGILFGLVGLIIGIQPFLADSSWNRALRPINPETLIAQSKVWPLSYMRVMHASSIFTQNGKPEIGLELAKFASEKFPDVLMVWQIMLNNPTLNDAERKFVKENLHRLDPKNPEYFS